MHGHSHFYAVLMLRLIFLVNLSHCSQMLKMVGDVGIVQVIPHLGQLLNSSFSTKLLAVYRVVCSRLVNLFAVY